MRKLVHDVINGSISRRQFLGGMAAASFSPAAAASALASVEPFVPGSALPENYVRTVSGTGGDLLVEQVLETGAKYLFVSNGSGLGPICDSLVDHPGLQLIQATHEGQVVAIADGYAKATGRTAFGMFSRVGLPHSSSNMYNAMKDRTPLVLFSDHADSDREGTDSHEDVDDWINAVRPYTKWRWTVHLIEAIRGMATPRQLQERTAERRAKCAAHTAALRAARIEAGRNSRGAPVPWARLMYELKQQMEKDAVVVDELGTEMKTLGFFPFADDAMMKIGRTEGRALGWGTGASAGVKLALPDRQVVSLQGDGGFLFGQTDSLWTMSRYDIPVMTVVTNNHTYEETRWQIMNRGGRAGKANRDYVSYLGDPDVDFTKLASAYNIPGAVVTNSDELRPAIQKGLRTLKEGRPFMLDVHTRTFGTGAEVPWYPDYSVAAERRRKV